MARDLRPVYTAATEQAAKERLGELHAAWGEKYPAVIRLWNNAWTEFALFLDYGPGVLWQPRIQRMTLAVTLGAELRFRW